MSIDDKEYQNRTPLPGVSETLGIKREEIPKWAAASEPVFKPKSQGSGQGAGGTSNKGSGQMRGFGQNRASQQGRSAGQKDMGASRTPKSLEYESEIKGFGEDRSKGKIAYVRSLKPEDKFDFKVGRNQCLCRFEDLKIGTRVSFSLQTTRGGSQAYNLRIIE